MAKIPCEVFGVFVKVTEEGAVPLVVLKTTENVCVPIFVGLWEAVSIFNALRGEVLPRPITHDLLIDLLDRFTITVDALQVDSLEDGVFFSTISLAANGSNELLDCRPSDGIAIAIRARAPIFLDEQVCRDAGVKRSELEGLRDIAQFL